MNGQPSQSQPSQFETKDSKPPLQHLRETALQIQDELTAIQTHNLLLQHLRQAEDQQFQTALKVLNIFFRKGYSALLIPATDILRKMMNHFTKLSKSLDNAGNPITESRMLFVLSVIAQLIKQQPKFYFPFTRKFLINVFSIDNQLLEKIPQRNQILAILGVIYSNLAMQGRLIRKLNVEELLKKALLSNFSLINELFTLKLFNRALLNLSGRLPFSSAELHKYQILETISNFISKNQMELFVLKVRARFIGKELTEMDNGRLGMVPQ